MELREDTSILVAAALEGCKLSQIAERTGLSVSSVQRRLREPEIKALIQDAREQGHREVVGQLGLGVEVAVGRLIELVSDEDAGVALRAADLTIRHSARWAAVLDVEERLALVEARLAQALSGDSDDGDQ